VSFETEFEAEQGDLLAEPLAAKVEAVEERAPPITRIVDPAAAEEGDEPLFAEPMYEERRASRGGFLSLFGGRPRYEAPARQPLAPTQPAASASRGGAQAQPVETPIEARAEEPGEDLEIPSFLRRLAN
jgi:cell division protein FtsZ